MASEKEIVFYHGKGDFKRIIIIESVVILFFISMPLLGIMSGEDVAPMIFLSIVFMIGGIIGTVLVIKNAKAFTYKVTSDSLYVKEGTFGEFRIPITDIKYVFFNEWLPLLHHVPFFKKVLRRDLCIKTKTGKNYYLKGRQVVGTSTYADYEMMVNFSDLEKLRVFFSSRNLLIAKPSGELITSIFSTEKRSKEKKLQPEKAIKLTSIVRVYLFLDLLSILLGIAFLLDYYLIGSGIGLFVLLFALPLLFLSAILRGISGLVKKEMVKINLFGVIGYWLMGKSPTVFRGKEAVHWAIIDLLGVGAVIIGVVIVYFFAFR